MRELVIEILAKELRKPAEDIAAATSLAELGVESLDMVSVVMSLEDRLSIHIRDRDLQTVRSLEDLVTLAERIKGDHASD